MPRVGFEPIIPEFERTKTVHALDRTAIAIGESLFCMLKIIKPCTIYTLQSHWHRGDQIVSRQKDHVTAEVENLSRWSCPLLIVIAKVLVDFLWTKWWRWVVTPCSPVHQCFEGAYGLHLQPNQTSRVSRGAVISVTVQGLLWERDTTWYVSVVSDCAHGNAFNVI
jgi:hypothetical protein